jgi:hypothetical protein
MTPNGVRLEPAAGPVSRLFVDGGERRFGRHSKRAAKAAGRADDQEMWSRFIDPGVPRLLLRLQWLCLARL